ncbi:MAG: CD225/dispanin family protein [Sphingobacterium sp.]|uniref:CD225/dispanin family protein n=1 Tax=Sphingobacterium sp. JB170 TaxID=1434842 RepID=UPI00097F17DB|nr:CD225/dispanin family protein [Sphingobacterium sp. JB170]SJN50045.1 Ssl1046 protein [Sphingobacterium sp. JB170]
MQKYYYTDGAKSFGPFSIDELKTKGITGDTYVWMEGMANWALAKTIPELAAALGQSDQPYYTANAGVPPQFSPIQQQQNTTFGRPAGGNPPKNYLVETILTTIFCCWPLGIPSIIYAARVEKKFYRGDIAGSEIDSANAKKWMTINIIACVVVWLFYGALLVFGVFAT